MIHYDPHKWLHHFFDLRGSLVKEIIGRVLLCVAWSAAIVYIHRSHYPLAISSLLHSLVGLSLGLLLVFRTNASYDRFWEARKLWGGITNSCRNLIRAASIQLGEEPRLLQHLTRLTAAFPFAAMHQLRGSRHRSLQLPPALEEALRQSQHPPLAIATAITDCLHQARRRGLLSDYLFACLDLNVQHLIDHLGGCERIRKTPLPFAYVVHLRRALVVYCFTLPFALVETFGWGTVLDVFVVTYTLFGIEEIGVEIEGPFGHDDNDLPLEEICTAIQHNLYALVQLEAPVAEPLPEGL